VKQNHISMFSGGIASWGASKLVQEDITGKLKAGRLRLVFTDTCMEDEDLYRFLPQAAANVFGLPDPLSVLRPLLDAIPPLERLEGRPPALRELAAKVAELVPDLVWIIDGRNPWDVFHQVRMLGNTRMDPCSRVLKREPAQAWLEANCDPDDTAVYVGISWSERHRFEGQGNSKGIRQRQAESGWEYDAPLLWPGRPERQEIFDWLKEEGIEPPRTYALGFTHANCGSFCIRAGQAHYRKLLATMPDRYRYHEEREEAFSRFIGKTVSVLRNRTGGLTKPLPLRVFRERVEAGYQPDLYDSQGCGCFINDLQDE
jgi:hypothetical protein